MVCVMCGVREDLVCEGLLVIACMMGGACGVGDM